MRRTTTAGPTLATIRSRDVASTVRGHLADDVYCLAAYALGDKNPWPHSDDDAWDALYSLASSLYGVTPGAWDANADLPGSVHPTSAIPVVILAALCRARIARGLPVTYRQLGCLAGVTGKTVLQLAARGELRAEGGAIPAIEARRWLAAREDVAGFLHAKNT